MVNFSSTELDPTDYLLFGNRTTWSLTVYALISITGIIANVFLLLAIFKDPLKCFSTPTTYFIVNLAVSDLLNLAVCLTFVFLIQTKYGGLNELTWNITLPLLETVFNLTFPSVFSLALERCLAVSRPLWHRVRITSRVCRIWLVAVWLFNLVFTLTSIFMYKYIFSITQSIFYGLMFLLITLFVYIFAYVSIRWQHKAMAADDTMSEQVRRTINARLKIQNRFLFTVFIINGILILCLLPKFIDYTCELGFGQSLSDILNRSNTLRAVVLFGMDILFLINFAVNPFIYCWRLPKYRKTFFSFFNCRR